MKFCSVLSILVVGVGLSVSALAFEEPLPGSSGDSGESLLPEDAIGGSDTASEAYGVAGGYIHPYLTIAGEYTDNLYNINYDERSNFLTRISPGIWFALPRTREVPITITPHNSSAGGLQHELEEYARDEFNRFNAYLLGGLDFEFYSENSDLNTTNGRLEGLARYNMKNGLSLQVLDSFSRDMDMLDFQSVFTRSQRLYYSNLLGLTADWEISERLRAKVGYGNFYLDYDEKADDFLDRMDNSLSLHGYVNYTEKSSFFVNYDYVDVAYDVEPYQVRDNTQHFFYIGWDWASTEKTDLLVKVGYQVKDYNDNSLFTEDPDGFAFELQGEHDFTQKTKLVTVVSRKMEETDSYVASGKTVLAFRVRFLHEFSERLTGQIDFEYNNADYDQIVPQEREDDEFFIRPGVQYVFNDWFMGEIAYSYDTRNSTDDQFDFNTNTLYLLLNFAL